MNDPAQDRDFIIPTAVEQAEEDGTDFGFGALTLGRKAFIRFLANHLQVMRGSWASTIMRKRCSGRSRGPLGKRGKLGEGKSPNGFVSRKQADGARQGQAVMDLMMVRFGMARIVFQSVLSIEEWRAGGRELGRNCTNMKRGDFEAQIVLRLVALDRLFKSVSDEALAAYDQGAWEAWEAGRGYSR